ncbi:MFS transporter [Cellulomonas sp. HZM]|uniref:MFS transporter n=1 Tax=Cellulomonas sp. HZM TaxID=1454010 RepID=UPI0004932259|nr:MFS transporter [Cellulomonas sp. HZM]
MRAGPRVSTSAGFAAQGFVLVMILSSLGSIEDRYGVDDGAITAAVLGVLVAAALGTGVADMLSRRAGGSRSALALGLVGIGVIVPLLAVVPSFALAVVGFAVYGLFLGMVDAGTNMQAVSVQRDAGRPIMAGFYASWSAGAILAPLVVSATADSWPIEPVHVLFLLATPVTWTAAALVWRDGHRGHDVPLVDAADRPRAHIPWRAVSVLGVAVVAFFVADNAAQTWSTIYLDKVLHASDRGAPLALAAYLTTTLVSRLVGDRLVARFGRVRVVRVASLVGAAGLLAVIVAPGPLVAIVGFAVTGAGLGLIAPLCFSAAGALAPDHADAVIARLNIFNYVGTLLGAVLVGAIGSASSFRAGFVVPVVLVLVVTAIAGRFAAPARDEQVQEVAA